MRRLEKKGKDSSLVNARAREGENTQEQRQEQGGHPALVASAHAVFGNRAVGAALRGEALEGPEAILHASFAFAAAGIDVGNNVNDVLENSAVIRLLANQPIAPDFAPSVTDDTLAGGWVTGALEAASATGTPTADPVAAAEAMVARSLARKPGTGTGQGATSLVDRAARTGARPLPSHVQAEMEARFGESFDDVRVHTDGAAQAASDAVQARAYTVGNEIWFGRNEFRPDSPQGLELLAHELTHVLQNRAGDARSEGGEEVDGVAVSSPGDARELEAEATAKAVMATPTADLDLADGAPPAAGGSPVATEGALSRDQNPNNTPSTGTQQNTGNSSEQQEKPRDKKLPDGTTVTIYPDGKGSYYVVGPKGDRMACDKEGNPTEAAIEAQTAKARTQGDGAPKPPANEDKKVADQPPDTKETNEKPADTKGAGNGNGTGTDTSGVGTGSGGGGGEMGTFAQLSGGPLQKYAHEKAWHDVWKAGGGQTGSLNTVGAADKAGLIGDALLSGGAEGFVNGAQAMLIDAVLNKATKNIPYAAGFIAMAQIAYDPKKWWEDTVVQGIGGKVGEGIDKLTSDKSDWIDKFEGVISILEGLNNIIGLASTVCMIVAAAGFILSFICPALIPFVALAAKWGLLLGEINTIVGLGINILRMIVIVCRAVQIAVSDADPKTQAERAAKLKKMMSSWSEDFTKRQGAKLQQKLQSGGKKTDGPDAQGGQSKPAGGGGDSGGGTQASSQKQGWKSRLTKIGSEVTGIGDMKQQAKKTFVGDKATGQKSTYQQTKELTKTAFGKGSQREKWNAMQRTDGELATQNTQDRYDRYLKKKETAKKSELMAKAQKSNPQLAANINANQKALKANRQGQGLVPDDGKSAFGDRDKSLAGIKKKATDPDFWDDSNKAQRKSVRRQLEKSSNPDDRKLAASMKKAEQRLAEFNAGKQLGPGQGDNAVVRVTQESGLHKRGTVGPRGAQGVTKLKDVRGTTSGQKMGKDLGMEDSYVNSVQNGKYEHTDRTGKKTEKGDSFVAAIYTPNGKPKQSTLKAMTDLIEQHGNADGLFGKKKGDIHGAVSKAMNTPAARKPDGSIDTDLVKARPDIYGSLKIQEQKLELEKRLGANQQKTSDGKTLTVDGHQKTIGAHIDKMDAIKQAQDQGKLSQQQADAQRNKARQQHQQNRKGDSHKEFYDDQTAKGQTNPLARGSAKKLEDYEELPVVKRLEWDKKQGVNQTPEDVKADSGKRSLISKITDEINTNAASDLKKSVKDGVTDTLNGFRPSNWRKNLSSASDLPANGYGHDGTGGYGGAGIGPVQQIINGSTSQWEKPEEDGPAKKAITSFLRGGSDKAPDPSGIAATDAGQWMSKQVNSLTSFQAVNPDGTPRMDADGKPGQVGIWDRAKSGMTGGLIGKDAAGNDNYDKRNAEFVEKEKAELQARLKEFDEKHISATDSLTDAPVAQEGVVDSADFTYKAYAKEIEALKQQATVNKDLQSEAATTKTKLADEKKTAETNKTSIGSQKTELQTKKSNQDKADTKINEQSSKGGELSGTTGKVVTTVANFVIKFAEMCGMIPSRLTSSGQKAASGANKIGEGVKGANDAGKTTSDKSAGDKAVVGTMRSTTENADKETTEAESELSTLDANIASEQANTDAGICELQAADGTIQDKISTLEGKKEEEKARHAGAVSAMAGWADTHEAARTGKKTEGEKALEDMEKKQEELKKKASEGGGEQNPVGDFPDQGVGGTMYADAAGPMPASAPKALDPNLLNGGAAMPNDVQTRMERTFGTSFHDVQFHTDTAAQSAAAGFNFKAFAFGSQVFFGPGQFRPGTPDGDRLIAHELSHVSDNRRRSEGKIAAKPLRQAASGGPEEQLADKRADQVVAQLHGRNGGVGPAGKPMGPPPPGSAGQAPSQGGPGPRPGRATARTRSAADAGTTDARAAQGGGTGAQARAAAAGPSTDSQSQAVAGNPAINASRDAAAPATGAPHTDTGPSAAAVGVPDADQATTTAPNPALSPDNTGDAPASAPAPGSTAADQLGAGGPGGAPTPSAAQAATQAPGVGNAPTSAAPAGRGPR